MNPNTKELRTAINGSPHGSTSVVVTEGGDLMAFFAEMSRLVAEAQSWTESGEVLRALSALAALPQMHHMVVDRCGALLSGPDDPTIEEPDVAYGLYL